MLIQIKLRFFESVLLGMILSNISVRGLVISERDTKPERDN